MRAGEREAGDGPGEARGPHRRATGDGSVEEGRRGAPRLDGAPGDRRLDRAPGDRYAGGRRSTESAGDASAIAGGGSPAADAARGSEVPALQPRLGLALLYGGLAVIGVGAAWAVAVGLLDVSWGLVFVAAIGGWVIGGAVAFGAWREAPHPANVPLQAIAAGGGVLAWLFGSFGAYLVALLVLPASQLSLAERMANVPFHDALATQFSLVDVASIVLLMVVAWRSAR